MLPNSPGDEITPDVSKPPLPEPAPEAPATPAPVEEKAPETPAQAPEVTPAPEYWNKLPKQAQEYLVKELETGENLTKHVLKLYDKLGREINALENERKALGQPKPAEPERIPGTRQAQELKVLKQTLTELAQKDPAKWEEYETLYKTISDRASAVNDDDQPLTRAEIKAMLQEEWEAREMNNAALQLVQQTKGKLDPDKAFALVNGLTANGMSVDDAVQTITGLFSSVEKAAASDAAGTITQPKPKNPIVAPGTQPVAPPVNREMTDDELAEEVKRLAMEDAKLGR